MTSHQTRKTRRHPPDISMTEEQIKTALNYACGHCLAPAQQHCHDHGPGGRPLIRKYPHDCRVGMEEDHV
jgi:hypothetical protein